MGSFRATFCFDVGLALGPGGPAAGAQSSSRGFPQDKGLRGCTFPAKNRTVRRSAPYPGGEGAPCSEVSGQLLWDNLAHVLEACPLLRAETGSPPEVVGVPSTSTRSRGDANVFSNCPQFLPQLAHQAKETLFSLPLPVFLSYTLSGRRKENLQQVPGPRCEIRGSTSPL